MSHLPWCNGVEGNVGGRRPGDISPAYGVSWCITNGGRRVRSLTIAVWIVWTIETVDVSLSR